MEGAAAAGLYVAEHVAEAGAAAYKGLTLSTAPLSATFTRIKAPSLPRSSQSLSVIGNRAYIFGGEISPRKPVDNAIHIVTLPSTTLTEADYQTVPAKPDRDGGPTPEARVGHAATTIDDTIFIFGGRGGADMKALEEKGRIWTFNTRTNEWSHIDPAPESPIPPSRSYHALTSTPYPQPQSTNPSATPSHPDQETPNIPSPANRPQDPAPAQETLEPATSATYGTLLLHAGCLSSGGRTCDLWTFDLASRTWAELPSAPDPGRGGTLIAMVRDRLYRFGGFDGTNEQGGQIDYIDFNMSDSFSDKSGAGPMPLSPRRVDGSEMPGWRSDVFSPENDPSGKTGNRTAPANRSVCGLAPVTTGQGREYLLIVAGEGSASSVGHEAAGKFFDDVWSFQLKPEGMSAGAVKDAVRGQVLGKGTGEGQCVEVKYLAGENSADSVAGDAAVGSGGESEGRTTSLGEGGGRMIQEGQKKPLGHRGWFACEPLGEVGGRNSVLVHGGVGADNERLGDMWVISVE